jgi:hypothetical protein
MAEDSTLVEVAMTSTSNDGDNNDAGNAGLTSLDEAFPLLEDSDHGLCAVQLLIVIFIITFNLTNLRSLDASNMEFFEDLCRAHIQAFAKRAEEFAFNTHLSARVHKWKGISRTSISV